MHLPWVWWYIHFRRGRRVALVINKRRRFELNPYARTRIMIQVTAGHSVDASIVYLDQNGNPMLTTPTPDSLPTWTDAPSAPGIDTLTVSPDGSTAVVATNPADADSSDTLSLSVTVGGKNFTASVAIAISAAPQLLTSIEIATSVS